MRQFFQWFAGVLLLVSVAGKASAGIDVPVIKALDGSIGQLKVDSSVMVEDAKFFDPAYNSILQKPYAVKNMISFGINEEVPVALQSAFTVTARLRIIFTDANNNNTTIERNFTINYDPGNAYGHQHTYVFNNAYRVEVKVLSLDSGGVNWPVTRALKIVNQLQSFPQYVFHCTNSAVQVVNKDGAVTPNTGLDELPVWWTPAIGADEYDLEWTYIDSTALADSLYGDPAHPDPNLIFENNATRVTITASSYRIPLFYDNRGHLFFRVRSVQWSSGFAQEGGRYEANWSSSFTNGLGRFNYDGHERPLNWQSTTTFAEDGKRKTVLQYFDGSLRGRQTVTKDNTTNRTIVTESLYDYQGRPVIQVLPAPTLSNIINYTKNFNRGIDRDAYDKGLYDTLPDPSMYCTLQGVPMDTTSGASRYYSSANDSAGSDLAKYKYIPDANGYPFTEVEYTQDNTGRISRQSGVGKDFRIGSGHETRYFYATPDQRELDALFGTEAGDRSHYFKNAVRDANGQYSISYLDMRGRTIATALAGTPPDSIKLDKLASNTGATRIESLADPASVVIRDLVMENKKGLLVTTAGNHSFTYRLDPQVLQLEGCDPTAICYDCLYDLQITITDDCNNQKLGGAPFDTLVRNFSLSSIDTTCHTNSGFSFTFVKWLPEGSYEVTKKLSVSRYAKDYYRDSVFLQNNHCKNIEDFIREQREILAGNLPCKPSCEGCTDSVGTWQQYWNRFRASTGIRDADTADYRAAALESYNKALEECKVLCGQMSETDNIRQAMLMDMTPSSGQYANTDNDKDPFSIFAIVNGNISYQQVTNYKNEEGQPEFVADETGTLQPPQKLSPEQFVRNFKPSWAEALLTKHPEYCKLEWYEVLKTSHEWDRRFEAVDTYSEARQKGYLNPTNNTNSPFSYFTGTGTIDADPLATLEGGIFRSDLENAILYSKNFNGQLYTLWGVATVTAVCPGNADITCYNKYQHGVALDTAAALCAADRDMAWRAFRQMYLDIKRGHINDWLKTKCGSTPSAATLMAAGHQPHFGSAEEMIVAGGADLPTTGGQGEVYKQQHEQQVKEYYDANCRAYVKYWIESLSGCVQYDSASLANFIIPNLLQVCREGADEKHPYGASSVKPSSTNRYRSFEEVLRDFNRNHNIKANNCNAYGIKAPKPYDQQAMHGNKPMLTKPDSCECAVINTYQQKYQRVAGSYTSFSDYMKKVYRTNMSDSVLNLLLGLCNGTTTCNFLEAALVLPPAFQCNTGDICIDCDRFRQLDNEFHSRYPGVMPADDMSTTDSVQLSWNNLYEQFFNHRLGFNKTVKDYLLFARDCDGQWRSPGCDSLNKIVADFKIQRQNNYGILTQFGTSEGEVFSNFRDIVHEGTIRLPDTIRQRPGAWYNNIQVNLRGGNFCWSNGYAVEARLRFMDFMFPGDVFYVAAKNLNVTFTRVVNPFVYNGVPVGVGFYLTTAYEDQNPIFIGYHLVNPDTSVLMNWSTVKLQVALSSYSIYFNGVLVKTIARNPATPIENSPNFVLGLRGRIGNVDWLKLYDGIGQVKYFEDYLDIDNPVLPDRDYYCPNPAPDCQVSFTQFFNQRSGTNYSYSQLDSLFRATCTKPLIVCADSSILRLTWLQRNFIRGNGSCTSEFAAWYNNQQQTSWSFNQIDSIYAAHGLSLDLCNSATDSLRLCGRSEPVFPPITLEAVDNCSDSTFFISSIAQELYKVYLDSLRGRFDSIYIAKCLQAYKYESFTVRHAVSEYHYTLYYYDQGGNLVKTIPPAGVQSNHDSLWLNGVAAARLAGTTQVPAHGLPTQYRYNTLNQVIAQKSPDGGQSAFWYDRLGRLAISQNARQKAAAGSEEDRLYSYTQYDLLGRITEVGQVKNLSANNAMTDAISRNPTSLASWMTALTQRREQITQTVYDVPYSGFVGAIDNRNLVQQRNLRNRVSFVTYTDHWNTASYNQGTFYTYDIHGNVDTLLQDYGCGSCGVLSTYNIMNKNGNRFKKTTYQYDLISGKVNMVQYQRGWTDQFFHRYSYDAENRLTLAETSLDSLVWEKDARYEYYLHGPLARVVLGQQQVQGVDYAYTLQGWLKGVNSTGATAAHDMGSDGKVSDRHQYVARDAYGFNLNYFGGDYDAINKTERPFPHYSARLNNSYRPLYNGNISSMSSNIRKFDNISNFPDGSALFYNYTYDQLNRLTAMDVYNGFDKANNRFDTLIAINSFKERVAYDPNGNITKYSRNANGWDPAMDRLTYNYYPGTNRLQRIHDSVASNKWGNNSWDIILDIDNQEETNNYVYDEIGNLVQDKAEKITDIKWNVYGKITEFTRLSTGSVPVTKTEYKYDGQGNRIGKMVIFNGQKNYTWYVRDAQGNLLSVYTSQGNHDSLQNLVLAQVERYIYGSSRVGFNLKSQEVDNGNAGPGTMQYYEGSVFYRGRLQYELSNHLGNVLTTISDRKVGVVDPGNSSLISYYEPDMVSSNEYYPFGMLMRIGTSSTNYTYRMGFNGKENDWEAKGWMNQVDYGFRIHDPRIGRFLSVDPLTKSYPELTPYQYASNTPIQGIDLDGLELMPINSSIYRMKYLGNITLFNKTTDNYVVQTIYENIPEVLKDPVTKNLKLTNGGPVTIHGRDWDTKVDGGYVSAPGRFNNSGPDFYGKSVDAELPPTNSTNGLYNSRQRIDALEASEANASRISSAPDAMKEIKGIIGNISNQSIWNAKSKEQDNRSAFYRATRIIDYYFLKNLIGEKTLNNGQGRTDLTNFLTDGTLPNGNMNSKDMSTSQLDYNLRIINSGTQIMRDQEINISLKVQQKSSDLKAEIERRNKNNSNKK